MAGRLEFAASAAWGASLRARFNGFYTIVEGGCGRLQAELDVEWLLRLMDAAPPSRSKMLTPRNDEPLILYTDASGHPMNGLGAVLMDGDSTWWTKAACPKYLIGSLADRATQINPMEICGVILGLWMFGREIRGRRLLVVIDNQAALGAIKKGRSPVPDFSELVFYTRFVCADHSVEPSFMWVPSELNWSDAPSRGSPPLSGDWVPPVTKWQILAASFPGKERVCRDPMTLARLPPFFDPSSLVSAFRFPLSDGPWDTAGPPSAWLRSAWRDPFCSSNAMVSTALATSSGRRGWVPTPRWPTSRPSPIV